MVQLSKEEQEKRLEFLKKHRYKNCPMHKGTIPKSMYIGTFLCPECQEVWKVYLLRSGRYQWWYEQTPSEIKNV